MQNESLLHYWKERIEEWHTHVKLPHTHPIPGFIANPKLEEVFWKKMVDGWSEAVQKWTFKSKHWVLSFSNIQWNKC